MERTWISRARITEAWREGVEKKGRISIKRMPGEGKSGYWRREERRVHFRSVSSSRKESLDIFRAGGGESG